LGGALTTSSLLVSAKVDVVDSPGALHSAATSSTPKSPEGLGSDDRLQLPPEHIASPNPQLPPFFQLDQNGDIDWTKNVVNALILLVTLGYAAYTILDVDHGMTRGWTPEEIAMRIPLDNWQSYETSLAEKPIFTKTLINVVIYLLGDWLSQTVFQKKNVLDFDPWRTMRNGFIGLCFGPLVHEYYQFSDHILPVEAGLTNRLCKILMDQTIYLTVKCSIYIMAVGMLAGDDFETAQQSVKTRIKSIVTTAWKFWPLVHCVTYSVIPARHRILWVNCVDLIWSAILANMSNAKPQPDAIDEEAAAVARADSQPSEGPVPLLQAAIENVAAPVLSIFEPTGLAQAHEEGTALVESKNGDLLATVSTDSTTEDVPPLHTNATFALS
jgi:protein Mpv17